MKTTFTKVSLTHHTLKVERDDGSTEEVTLETKSFVPHDLIHLEQPPKRRADGTRVVR